MTKRGQQLRDREHGVAILDDHDQPGTAQGQVQSAAQAPNPVAD
jgi:hypothetical protein